MNLTLTYVTLGASDPAQLARFYGRLLGWPVDSAAGQTYLVVEDPGGGVGIGCQYEQHHQRPQWPGRAGQPPMQLHLEIKVDDLDAARRHALACGATQADYQPQADVVVCVDPEGHPFCLYL
ncbi:MAG: VOC family protein [Actinobacteria bacterium]|nr:VOC family protein [Actinomycetota bacterium]